MGGRGSSGNGSRVVTNRGVRLNKPATSILTQSGVVADLTGFPLVYGGNAKMTDAQKKTISAFEAKRKDEAVEYAAFVGANGDLVGEKKGGKTGMTVSAAMLMQTDVLSHNHPRKDEAGVIGGTFSTADMSTFGRTGIKTMRAVAAEGTYSITKGRNFDPNRFQSYYNTMTGKANMAHNARKRDIRMRYRNNKISLQQANAENASSFNHFLVDMHNALLAGAKQYGYDYTLERSK